MARAVKARPRSTQSSNDRAGLALWVCRELEEAYPDAKCGLNYQNPFELLVATVLSAQCTDARVNLVTPALFASYPDASAMAKAPLARLEKLVQSTGFFRAKAKSLSELSKALVREHAGEVPDDFDALTRLRGVGRKTANVVMGNAFGVASGVVVDTHVGRITRLLGLTRQADPVKAEAELAQLVPKKHWIWFSHWLIEHGRRVCIARRPKCGECVLAERCASRLDLSSDAGF